MDNCLNENTHVYCTRCINGEKLIKSIVNYTECPKQCKNCYPYNPEDSVPFIQRPNYIFDGNMTKEEMWNDLKIWLTRAVPELYAESDKIIDDEEEKKRLYNKAFGIQVVLERMQQMEKYHLK